MLGAYRIGLDGGMVTDVGIAYGGMAATPRRAPACEAAMAGRIWTAETAAAGAAALATDYAPIDDFRASAGYRATVAGNLVRRLHLQTTSPATVPGVIAL